MILRALADLEIDKDDNLWVGVMYWGRMLQFFGKSF